MVANRIKELDALRGIAALCVVLFHFTLGRPEAQYGFHLGITGVDLFFILSGFVIFMSVQKTTSALEFAINRFTRLYPTYWTCVSITALMQLLLMVYMYGNYSYLSVSKYVINLTMFQHYFKVNDIDGSYWTMIIEIVFYICILILLVAKKTRYILPFSLALLAIIGTYSIYLENIYPSLNSQLIYWFHLFTHFPLFLAGIIFYKIYRKEGKLYFNYLILLCCFIVQISLFDNFEKTILYVSQTEYMIMLGIFFLIFVLFVNDKLEFLVSRPILFLGKISFALYLIHQFISTEIIIPLLAKIGIHFWTSALIAFSICVLLATLITYFIEIPLGKKLNLFLRTKFSFPTIHS
ncbi:MAG: acyltransferase [Bacteroidota bacterium]